MPRAYVTFTICFLLVLAVTQVAVSQSYMTGGWTVDDKGGHYDQTDDTWHLWSDGGPECPSISLVKPINPTDDFTFQTQVYAEKNESCCIFVRSTQDSGSMEGFNFEFGHYGINIFLLARNFTDWITTQVAEGEAHVWYTMQLNISKSPFFIKGAVYSENGTCIGSIATAVINFGFDDIHYIGLSVWGYSPSDYLFRDIHSSLNRSESILSIDTESSSSKAGATVNIYGTLTDQQGQPLQNKTVVLAYTFAGLDSWIPISSTVTDEQGQYGMQWIDTASGTFTLKVQWVGDTVNIGASNTTTLTFLPVENHEVFVFESNSTVNALSFENQTSTLSFNVTGPSNTTGVVKVTIAKNMIANGEDLEATLDGNQLNYTVTSVGDSWIYLFNYHHSTHQISMHIVENELTIQPFGNEVILVAILVIFGAILGIIAYSMICRGNRELVD
jgi:hypothetical protein